MALIEPWSIKSRAHVCAVTERHFEDGESFYTAIFPDPDSSGYLRKDFSIEAWEQRDQNEAAPFSFWQSIYRSPVKEEEVEITEESPEDLLRRLIEEDEEHTENVRYILAVMLERKKQLVEVDNQPIANGIIRIYEHRKSGDVFIVKDPNIALDEVEKVQNEVAILLETGGRVPEVIPEPVSEAEPETDPEAEPSPSSEENEASTESLVNSSNEEE